jgi:hypothetical protein
MMQLLIGTRLLMFQEFRPGDDDRYLRHQL